MSVVAGCVNVGGSSGSSAASTVGVGSTMSGAGLFVDVGMLLIEGRVAEAGTPRGYKEGPHCPHITNSPTHHTCQDTSFLCERASKLRRHMSLLNENSAPMCIDVLLCPDCPCGQARANSTNICQIPSSADLLIEQWTVSVVNSKSVCIAGNSNASGSNSSGRPSEVPDRVLLQALRSQLHFSQLSAWYSLGKVKHVCYRLSHPVGCSGFTRPPVQHNFPLTKISPNSSIKVCLKSLPRTDVMPIVSCPVHSGQSTLNATVTVFKSVFAELGQCLLDPPARIPAVRHGFTMWRDSKASSPTRRQRQSPPLSSKINDCSTHTPGLLDDRLLSGCKHIGKHHCEDDNECIGGSSDEKVQRHKPYHHHHHYHYHHHHPSPPSHQFFSSSGNPKEASASCSKYNPFDLREPRALDVFNVYRCETYSHPLDSFDETVKPQPNIKHPDNHCSNGCSPSSSNASNSGTSKAEQLLSALIARGNKVNPLKRKWATSATATSTEGSSKKLVSSAATKATELAEYFTKLDISHHDDTLPPPPSPPPLPPPPRPNAPLAIPQRRTQFWGTDSSSEETEGESPIGIISKNKLPTQHHPALSSAVASARLLSSPVHRPLHHSRPLLGSFEENILSGRLQPVCKVDGFTADLGASGNFCPQHLKLPVTVSFFSVEPHSAPYLGEINLGKKGYTVPRSGTIQLTLLNPLGTVIKMFVVGYDVTDMPANSHTFIRQRTVSTEPPHANKLRYLIHLRLRSSKSGRISLMTDIQVILSRQYDVDSSVGLDFESGCLKSITITPSEPRYSANK